MLTIGTIVLGVNDVNAATKFWNDALGYVPREAGDDTWVTLVPSSGTGAELSLMLSETPVQYHPRIHLDLYAYDQSAAVELEGWQTKPMNKAPEPARRPGIRAAMFVDFDNVFTGLQALDPAAARRFAEDPKQWADALSDGGAADDSRRFLIRNCYLNPMVYSKYRPYWTRAGFRVIDCPSLTQRGKSSTDINLVLDAMDALSGSVAIEEFFIASADADFTSLIQRFRAADRMTTVIAAGAVAFAYREMADHVVESHDFVAILNGTTAEPIHAVASAKQPPGPATAKSKPKTDSPAVAEVLKFVRSASGPVKGALVEHRALSAEPSLKTDWAGLGRFGAWVAQIGKDIEYSPAKGGWVWDAKRFSAEDLPAPAEVQ